MPIVTSRCVVLQVHRYSDTSKILRLLTRSHGPQSVIARGALRPKSRLGGLLELFTEGNATFYLKPERDLHTLSGFELLRARQLLGADLSRFAGASVLCELVLRIAPREADPGLFDLLAGSLDLLLATDEGTVRGTVAACAWQLIAVLGFAPSLEVCVDCGRSIGEGEPGRFDLEEGGLRCAACPASGIPLDGGEVADLRALASGDPTIRPSARQLRLMTDFIRYHAAEGYRIRSLDFLEATAE